MQTDFWKSWFWEYHGAHNSSNISSHHTPLIKRKCCNGNFLWCFFCKKCYNKITGEFASCNLCLRSELSLKPGLEIFHSIGTGNCCAAVCFQICEIQTGEKILYHFYQWNFYRRKPKSKVYESHRILHEGICQGVISETWRTSTETKG